MVETAEFAFFLHFFDLCPDRYRGFSRLQGELFDLGGNNGEPTARLPGPSGLNSCIDRQEISLKRNQANQVEHFTNFSSRGT